MERNIVLVGGGGHCRSVIDAIESCGRRVAGVIDLPTATSEECLGYPVIGTDDDIPHLAGEFDFVVTLGSITNPQRRIQLHEMIEACGGHLATVVASTAHVSRHATLGAGTVVLHFANVNAGARVGRGCIINTHANVEHDAEVGDYCHVSTGAMINGGCRVGDRTFIGSGAVVNNGVHVGSDVVLASGSVATVNLLQPGIWARNPARCFNRKGSR